MAFEQHQIKVIEARPDHASYIKGLQYAPDVVLLEFPSYYTEQLHFAKNMSNSISKKKKLLVIGYGHKMEEAEERALTQNGVKHYLNRPLKFSLVMKHLEDHLGVFAPDKIVWKKKNQSDEDENYVEIMFNIDILPSKKLDILSERISNLMAFPFTVMKVLQLTEDSSSGANDLAKVINTDPVISANILKLSNTVFFASRNRRISTIKDAIIRIGFKETKHITMAMSVMNMLNEHTDNIGFDRLQFWYHSLAVAVISEKLAKNVASVNESEMFLTGLLHSFGIILLDEFFADLFEQLLVKTTDKSGSFQETERELMIITHNDLTHRLFEKWKIPPSIAEAIKLSTDIGPILDKEEKNIIPDEMCGIVLYTADIVAKAFSLGKECDSFVGSIDASIFSILKMPAGLTEQLLDSVQHDVDIYRRFLTIEDDAKETPIGEGKKVLYRSPIPPHFDSSLAFLKSAGFEMIPLKDQPDMDEYDEKYDFVFISHEGDFDSSLLEPLKNIRSTARTPIQTIVVCDNPPPNNGTTFFFPREFDLRHILISAQQIMNPTEES